MNSLQKKTLTEENIRKNDVDYNKGELINNTEY